MKRLDETANGIYVIAATPFTDAGEIDWGSVDSLIEFYLGHGIHGMTILGVMGEAQKLGEAEQSAVACHMLKRVNGRIPVIVGVSSSGDSNLVRLGKLSMDNGAAGVMVAPPIGQKTEQDILRYFEGIVGALGPKIPVVYQDYPQLTNAHVSPESIVRLVDVHPSMVMLKHEDCPGLRKLSQVRQACDGTVHRRISILCGNGGLYLPQEIRRGADGAMTGFAFPEMLVRMYKLFRSAKADEAEDQYDLYLPLIRYEQQPGIGLAIRKEILRRRGAIKSASVRAPGPRLDSDDVKELEQLLARLERQLGSGGWRGAAAG